MFGNQDPKISGFLQTQHPQNQLSSCKVSQISLQAIHPQKRIIIWIRTSNPES
uniref:Uncharacterized protein n=1 Tax=Rhizophora mucronata TaxID=61149 RepID=A0A2P2JB32_RHIMU